MSSYITNTKPSLLKIILNKIGIIDLPIKVNCWFCNNDSYLLPGTKNTIDYWYCHLCENTNARDEQGEILDPSPIVTSRSLDEHYTIPTGKQLNMDNQRTLCEECLAKQQLVYQLLSEYIPDEDDPSYESRCESADRYKAELHQRHKVCNECQAKINQLVQEQFITLRKKGANTNVLESQILASKGQQIESLTRLKRCSLRLKMVCFVIVHITTIAFLLMAIQYPPYRSYISFESSKLKNVLSYDTWGECFEQLMMAGFSLFVKDTWRLILTFSHCMLVNDLATCDWDVHSYLGRLSLLNMASFYIYNWHPILSSRFIYEEHIKYWTLYKAMQNVLSLIRFSSTVYLLFANEEDMSFIKPALFVYLAILITSLFIVRQVNRTQFAFMLTKSYVSEQEDENVAKILPEEEQMSILEQDDPVELITSSINRIYM